MRRLTVRSSAQPWFKDLSFEYHEQLKNFVAQFPGCSWVPDRKVWRCPIELVETVSKRAKDFGLEVQYACS